MPQAKRQAVSAYPEEFDLKARFVGGVVLFVIMISLYAVLKAVLGISSTGVDYALRAPLPDEVPTSRDLPAGASAQPKLQYPIINKFFFLNLDGYPIDKDVVSNLNLGHATGSSNRDYISDEGEGDWYVQAASMKEYDKAQALVRKIQAKKMKARVVKVGKWYAVRLFKTTKSSARRQKRRLRQTLGLKAIVKKIK